MGRYSDAFNAGETEKQAVIDAEKKRKAAEQEARNRAMGAANNWFDDVLTPVVMEARTDLQSSGLAMQFQKVPGDPIQGAISISGNAKSTAASIHVRPDGVVTTFGPGGQTSTLNGHINSVTREQVAHWLESIIRQMAKS